jgi:hypothetical protein
MPFAASEPCARRLLFVAHREAAEQVFGRTGVAKLAERLPEDTRAATIDPLVLTAEWLPERHLVAWQEAAWEGPCARDVDALFEFLHAMMDRGFGRIQKFMLGLIPPGPLFNRGASLWRHDHTHGELTCLLTGERSGVLRLRDHPYTASPLVRRSTAEILRYAGSLTRCKTMRSSHTLDADGTLVIRVEWE